MRERISAVVFCFVTFCCGVAMSQESAALTGKDPIKLTKVEGRMDHMSTLIPEQREP